MSENKPHPHAALMAEYAKDAAETSTPWVLWQVKRGAGIWDDLLQHPGWNERVEYRRKPKTIRIGEFDVPEPLRVAPEIRATYYVPSFYNHTNFSEYHWANDGNDRSWLKNGMCHSTKAAAQLHSKALISLTAQK